MKLIETKTLAIAAASIDFTSIPQDATDLVAVCSLRNSADDTDVYVRFNGDTGTNYTTRHIIGTGTTVTSASYNLGYLRLRAAINASSYTANTFGNSSVYIPNYTNALGKTLSHDGVSENNATASAMAINSGVWTGTAAITSLTFLASNSGNLVIGSTISLYKITSGSDGIVTVA